VDIDSVDVMSSGNRESVVGDGR